MAKRKLPSKKKRWETNHTATTKGSKVKINATTESKLVQLAERYINYMISDVEIQVKNLFESQKVKKIFAQDADIATLTKYMFKKLFDKYERLFSHITRDYNKIWIDNLDRMSQTAMKNSLTKLAGGVSIKVTKMNDDIKRIIQASSNENSLLIKDIPRKYLTDVATAVSRTILAENQGGMQELTARIDNLLSDNARKTRNRAKNIALDQTRKLYNHLNSERAQAAGVEKFEWVHTGGGQFPREYHRDELNGKIFRFDDPPIIDKNTGERGLPGDAINCRCTFIPVIEIGDDDGKS